MKKTPVVLILLLMCSAITLRAQKETAPVNQLVIVANNPGPVISRDIYGHFSEHLGTCIYGGIWVGKDSRIPNTDGIRTDVLNALREIRIPNLRWPGGCFADTYHWMDGIGPKENRASIINTHWGGVTEDNSFGTHEFMRLAELLECEPYISGNVGSGTIREMSDWVEYLTSGSESPMTRLRKQNGREEPWKVRYFAIGNENWGCGGNMTPEFYADVMRQFSTYLKNYSGNRLYKVACGASDNDLEWTEVLMKDPKNRNMFQGLSLHYYSVPGGWARKSSATSFTENEWWETFRLNYEMDRIIQGHKAIMDRYDPRNTKGLVIDEWGNWFQVEPGTNSGFLYQQNTLRDAITAAIHLNTFNQHADRVKVANLAQVVNVLQAVVLTKDDKMVLTPTYHVFRMFRVHHDAQLLKTDLRCEDYSVEGRGIPAITASASVDKEGRVHISIANLNPNKAITLSCPVIGETFKTVTGEVLTSNEMAALNTFEKPESIKPAAFNGFKMKDGLLTVTMPAKSVVVLELRK
ncbi:MAG: alpha-L-arabinofuranosidase C-terminal domain-containing protein [Bacteroidales bacterium]|jgi:alpha-N-arabinofuranosidase|nr:alpha-L-arabinofuranosidase C-terminal domain-containing protein [Bacteroidales bacterium]